jgi:tRNA(Ile)-lysidine synthase
MTTSPTLAVAVSGGRDSTALLHAVQRQARAAGLRVVALHIHHGLNPEADAWAQHVTQQCRRWRVACRVARLEGAPVPGQSVEAWARTGRYRELARLAREEGAYLVLLAHHRRDQAETVLLQALRGAGPAGLSAMPQTIEREGLLWCRPWLHHTAAAIAAYVQRWRLSHIEDDSNLDSRFDRNRLRHEVWPTLLQAFPQAETAMLAVAQQAQQATLLAQEIGEHSLGLIGASDHLPVRAWQDLPPATRRATLQLWLRGQLGRGAPEVLLQRLSQALPGRHSGRFPVDGTCELRLYRSALRLHRLPSPALEPQALAGDDPPWREVGEHRLAAWRGSLRVQPVAHGGVALHCLAQAELRPRSGGEQWQGKAGGLARSLKKQYQAMAVPAWLRQGPLVWAAGRLIFVPGLGLDARCLAPAGTPQVALSWLPDRQP